MESLEVERIRILFAQRQSWVNWQFGPKCRSRRRTGVSWFILHSRLLTEHWDHYRALGLVSVLFKLKLREKEAHVEQISKLRGEFVELFPRSKAQPNAWHASTWPSPINFDQFIFWGEVLLQRKAVTIGVVQMACPLCLPSSLLLNSALFVIVECANNTEVISLYTDKQPCAVYWDSCGQI